MRTKTLALLITSGLVLAACGTGEVVGPPDLDPDEPLIQIRSEGGFVPVEWSLGNGPTFTVTRGGSVIFQGITTLEYPGRLVPLYMIGQLDDEQMVDIRTKLDAMGIADIDDEHDDSVDNVADASTEVIRYWDENGVHEYSVYALGITDRKLSETTQAFADLFDYLHQIIGTVEASPYQPERVQVIAGADYQGVEPDFVDLRDWPIDGENPDDWAEVTSLGEYEPWTCKEFAESVLDRFEGATQATLWTHPTESGDAQNFKLLVRPLHPGEEACSF